MTIADNKLDRSRLIRAAALAGLAALAIAVTWDVWCDIFRTGWNDEETSQILLAPLAVAWIVWVRKGRFGNWRLHHQWIGTLLIAAGWCVCSLGYRVGRLTCLDAGAIVLLVGAVVTILGSDVITRFLPALGAMLFLIPPFPRRRYLIARPLGEVTARITQDACQLLHMQVQRHGNLLTLNGVNVSIAEACNGMRMVIVLLLVSYLYCFVMPMRRSIRAVLLISSPLTAIACNVIRLIPTVWMFGNVSARAAQNFHDVSGWLMIGVAFFLLMGIARIAERLPTLRESAAMLLKSTPESDSLDELLEGAV